MSIPADPDEHAQPSERLPVTDPTPVANATTVTAATPVTDATPVDEPSAEAGVARAVPRRHRALFWVAVVASLAAVGGGGALAYTAYEEENAPERIVLDYLTAVA